MQNLRDGLFPISLFSAWSATVAYTLVLISGSWVM
jgi:hypothetical protein